MPTKEELWDQRRPDLVEDHSDITDDTPVYNRAERRRRAHLARKAAREEARKTSTRKFKRPHGKARRRPRR